MRITGKEAWINVKYICTVCGWEYDEAEGYEDGGIAPGTKWEDIPEDFVCPVCGVEKDMFDQN
jgi:rubredoxin-NAD+ reductase